MLLGGLTPRHRESDTKIQRGSITKQGPPLVRWAAIEAVSKNHGDDPIKDLYRRVAERRGLNKGRVAAAGKVLTLVYYGLRDHEIRSLAPPEANGLGNSSSLGGVFSNTMPRPGTYL